MTAKEIAALRNALGLSQTKFAERIGVDKGTVSRWERDETHPRGLALRALERLVGRAKAKRPKRD